MTTSTNQGPCYLDYERPVRTAGAAKIRIRRLRCESISSTEQQAIYETLATELRKGLRTLRQDLDLATEIVETEAARMDALAAEMAEDAAWRLEKIAKLETHFNLR